MKAVPLTYAPDLETAWMTNPGNCRSLANLAPLARGSYGTIGSLEQITLTDTGYLFAKMFRSPSGSVRFLTFRATAIDEYNNTGTKTSLATGFNASTTGWSAAAFGTAVIACNYLDATQVSTSSGGAMSAIGSGCPKARLVAANSNFVMLADYDDSTNQYADGWWCSALGNYASWTASLATQAANGRILEAPGPIRALVPFRDGFVAFKDNSIHVMEYVGPPYIWSIRMVSNSVGAHGMRGVVELRNKLYFIHQSNVYEFDGANLRPIGDPIITTILRLMGATEREEGVAITALPGGSVASLVAVADDVENIVWFFFSATAVDNRARLDGWGYNVATGKWGRLLSPDYYEKPVVVDCKIAEQTAFGMANYKPGRVVTIKKKRPVGQETTYCKVYCYAYPYKSTTTYETHGAGAIVTGIIGEFGQAIRLSRVYTQEAYITDSNVYQVSALTADRYHDAAKRQSIGTVTGAQNSTLACFDINAAANYVSLNLTMTATVAGEIYGVAPVIQPQGQR